MTAANQNDIICSMKNVTVIKDLISDKEREFYNISNVEIVNCTFKGPADGESALKECNNFTIRDSAFCLRYPLWHVTDYRVENCTMDVNARASVWYGRRGYFKNCTLGGIKIFRECEDTTVENCEISSFESGWHCNGFNMYDCKVLSEYFLLGSRNIVIKNTRLNGKYPMQYVENVTLENCEISTKDCLWHGKNVTAKNCVFHGEYLAWYSENLTLIDCIIDGTQPLCYCKNLKLINCRTINCDLAFELSDIEADIVGEVHSIRSPLSGTITCDGVGEIVNDVTGYDCKGKVVIRHKS